MKRYRKDQWSIPAAPKPAELLRTERRLIHGQWVDVKVYSAGEGEMPGPIKIVEYAARAHVPWGTSVLTDVMHTGQTLRRERP